MDKQLVSVAFAGGIDTKTDKVHVVPGKLLSLQNGVFQQAGSVSKRWGYRLLGQAVLGQAPTISSAEAINAFGGELLAYDGQLAYSYSPARDAWVSRGQATSLIQSNEQIVRNSSQQLSPDFGSLGGVEVYAWEDSRGTLRYSVVDSAKGTLILNDQPFGASNVTSRPKVIAFPAANLIVIVFANTLRGGELDMITINPANPTATPTVVTLLPTLGGVLFFDAAVVGGKLVVVYYTAAPSGVVASALDSTLAIAWTKTVAAVGTAVGNLNVVGDAAGNAWITYADAGASSTTCSTAVYGPTGATVLAPVRVISQATGALQSVAALILPGTSTLQVLAEAQGSQPYNQVIYSNTVTIAGVLGVAAANAPVFKRSVGLASKPFSYGANWYVNVAFQTPLQPTYFTLDQSGNVLGKVNAGLGGGLIASSDFILPECPQVSPGVFKYANLIKGAVNTEAGAVLALLGVNATTLDFFDSNRFLSAAINGGLYTVGGVVQSYDGARYVEHGFHVYPEAISYTPHASGGAMAAGTYNYAVTYEWIDNNGLTQLSTPSVAKAVVLGAGSGSVTIVAPTLRLTKKSMVKIVVYRTTASGTTLLRVTSALVPAYNDPTVDTITITDTLADASILSNGAMYTQPLAQTGGNPVLPNSAPPACSLIATYADRVFLGGVDDPYTLWYTKPSFPSVPMEFSAAQTLRIDPDGGSISALARMDDKLVIFKGDAIFYLVGQGPTATGDSNDFLDPVQVPSGGVGCASQSTVVLTPLGLLFASANGIYLLDRGGNVSYKGAPVEAYTNPNSASYLGPITSATLVPNQWAIFTTAGGTALVYDYYFDQWSTFTNHAAIDSALYLGAGNLFAWANAQGQVFLQTPGTFTDAGSPIVLDMTTAWMRSAELQGYQRIYHAFLLGTYKGSHTLSVWCGFNYADPFTALASVPVDSTLGISTFGSSSPFGADALFGGGTAPDSTVYQFRVDVLRKCEAVRFRISDQQSAPGNEGFSLAALGLVIGVKKGGHKVPAVKQFGAS